MRFHHALSLTALLAVTTYCSRPQHPVTAPSPAPIAPPPQSTTPVAPPAPAPAPTPTTYERGITPRKAPPLPPVPEATGPLAIHLVWPSANQSIPVRDSDFVFGEVGNGQAEVTINGAPVRVAPNGTFVAFLPVPPASDPHYVVVARLGTDSAREDVRVRVPPPLIVFSNTGKLIVDSGTVTPRGGTLALRDAEPVRVAVRAAPGASAWVVAGGRTTELCLCSPEHFSTDLRARDLRTGGTLYVARERDTVHFALAKVADVDVDPPRFATLVSLEAGPDTDKTVIGRPTPAGTYKWMFVPGTVVAVTGRNGGDDRVRLDESLEVWVDSANVHILPANVPAPHRTVGAMTLEPSAEWVDVVTPVASPPPYLLEQNTDRLALTLYGTHASPDIIKFLGNDSLVRYINWVPEGSDRVRFTLALSQPPFGYLAMYDSSRGAFVLRIRRPPVVDIAHPLAGRTITVDPGHPPGGAIGPTGLTEAQAVLPIAMKLRDILEERGAHVVMTRTTMDAVDLHLRSIIARQANSDALISIHLNAFGDGIDPFPNVGTSTLYFHPQTEPLARLVQAGMMREMGLRDLGVHYQNIAIGRTTWMPSLICEGLFMMIPEQENAVKVPEFQERYARGVADGIEAYFRSLAK